MEASRLRGTIPVSIAGIPALVRPTRVQIVRGSYSRDAASDWDYYGYSEVEYDVLDRKGYRAKWLEAKITRKDEDAIKEAILLDADDD